MELKPELEKRARAAEAVLKRYIPREGEPYTGELYSSMEYALMSGGKRIRPVIMLEVYRLLSQGADTAVVEPFMAALEMIHSFSLVHDDMPEIDNDTLRRGSPTVWKKYGSHMALLCGDCLLNLAYETALTAFETCPEKSREIARALSYMASKSGVRGMMGGETADVVTERSAGDVSDPKKALRFIHENKTGALLQAAFVVGAILAGADEALTEKLSGAALAIGVAFQIRDDILDVEGEEEKLGKNIGSDEKSDKLTWVRLEGLEGSAAEADRLCRQAMDTLRSLPGDSSFLLSLMDFLVKRDH